MGIPQFIMLILLTMSLGMNVATKHGKEVLHPVVNYLIIMGLLWWGGYFT